MTVPGPWVAPCTLLPEKPKAGGIAPLARRQKSKSTNNTRSALKFTGTPATSTLLIPHRWDVRSAGCLFYFASVTTLVGTCELQLLLSGHAPGPVGGKYHTVLSFIRHHACGTLVADLTLTDIRQGNPMVMTSMVASRGIHGSRARELRSLEERQACQLLLGSSPRCTTAASNRWHAHTESLHRMRAPRKSSYVARPPGESESAYYPSGGRLEWNMAPRPLIRSSRSGSQSIGGQKQRSPSSSLHAPLGNTVSMFETMDARDIHLRQAR